MKSQGNNVVETMINAWLAVAPIRRASIRWGSDVRLYRRGRAVVVSHRPSVLISSSRLEVNQ